MFLCRNRQYLQESSMFCGGTFFQWNGCIFTMKWAFFEENKKKSVPTEKSSGWHAFGHPITTYRLVKFPLWSIYFFLWSSE